MKFALVAVGTLIGCTGSQVPSPSSPPPVTAQPQTAPPPQCTPPPQTAPCPPPPLPQVELKQAPSFSDSLRVFLPSTFWCTETRKTPGSSPLNVCYGTRDKCITLRKEATEVGAVIGECRESDSATCFSMVQDAEQRVHWRCYASMEECQSLRKRWLKDQPKMRFGQCGQN